MKSKKVEDYLIENERNSPFRGYVSTTDVWRAVATAEAEAEERMRTKACEIVRKMTARAFTEAIAFAIAREFFKELCRIQNKD